MAVPPHFVRFACHSNAIANATVVPPIYAAFANLPPPIILQPLPSSPSIALPLPLLLSAAQFYLLLVPPSVSLPFLMPSVSVFDHQSSPSTASEIVWDAAVRDTLLKAASRERFPETSDIKIRAFFADAESFSRSVVVLETSGFFLF